MKIEENLRLDCVPPSGCGWELRRSFARARLPAEAYFGVRMERVPEFSTASELRMAPRMLGVWRRCMRYAEARLPAEAYFGVKIELGSRVLDCISPPSNISVDAGCLEILWS